MNVEQTILKNLTKLLHIYDKKRHGYAIDVGVGTYNFYCELFAKNNYKTIAIEPLPSERLLRIIRKNEIELVQACLTDETGETTIYTGIFENANCPDVSSINRDWWGVTNKSQAKIVKTITLSDIIQLFNIERITIIKMDTEGSEYNIIKQFGELPAKYFPEIIEFEYGGGSSKKLGIGGWEPKYFSKTINIIKLLNSLGYKYLLLYESTNKHIKYFELSKINDFESIFQPDYEYGDILMFKAKKFIIINNALIFNFLIK